MGKAVAYFATKMAVMFATVAAIVLQTGCSGVVVESARVVNRGLTGTVTVSTYLGGSAEDSIRDVATDLLGNIFITGGTASPNFPATAGSLDTSFNGRHDVFVAKLDQSGSLIWSTFLGGPNYDRAYAIEVDSLGFVYVAGRAGADFPTTQGALQRTFAGDVTENGAYGQQDGFITKLTPDGSRVVWSTYFGSAGRDFIRDLDIDSAGNVFIGAADVTQPHPHVTTGAFQTALRGASDGVVAKVSANGASVVWASYFGGNGDDGMGPSIRVHPNGEVQYLMSSSSGDAPTTPGAYERTYAGGWDLILAKISADGSRLVYSTYLGGSAFDSSETHGLAIDTAGNAYIAISTLSTSLPTTAGAFQSSYGGSGASGTGRRTNYPGDVYVGKISADGAQLLAGTYLGGRFGEGAEGIAVDAQGNVYVSGATYSDNFPVTGGAFQTAIKGKADLFAAKLTGDLSQLSYSTYIGDSGIDYGRACATDPGGNVLVAGASDSANFPIRNATQPSYSGGDGDAVLAKIAIADGVTSALPKITGAYVSGMKLFVIGENFGAGAAILLNGEKLNKTSNDSEKPTTMLIAKKGGKKIPVGDSVRLLVRNPDGALSEVFIFTRPPNSN
jgi:hypothetical protein